MIPEQRDQIIAAAKTTALEMMSTLQREAKLHAEMRRPIMASVMSKSTPPEFEFLHPVLIHFFPIIYEMGFVDGILFGAAKGLEIHNQKGTMEK